MLARPFMDNIYPDEVESVEAVLAKLAAGEDIVGFECREVCADGSVRWFEWSMSSLPKLGIAYAVGRDVTERRKAKVELSALRHVATLAAEGELRRKNRELESTKSSRPQQVSSRGSATRDTADLRVH